METMPKPLCKRLVLTTLVGTGCLFVGIIFFLLEKDTSFLYLSVLIFLFSAVKAISTFIMTRNNSFVTIEGTCIRIQPLLLSKCNEVILENANGNNIKLLLDRNQKLQTGISYRIYFKSASSISPGKNPFMEKALLTDNLLGIEPIELPLTTSDTVSLS